MHGAYFFVFCHIHHAICLQVNYISLGNDNNQIMKLEKKCCILSMKSLDIVTFIFCQQIYWFFYFQH